jgi:hypothetical protein
LLRPRQQEDFAEERGGFRILGIKTDRSLTMATNVVDSIPETLRAVLKEFERTPLDLSSVSRMSAQGLSSNLDAWHRLRAVVDGAIVQMQGEVNRRESFREDGAPSSRDWQVARFGVSNATARVFDQVGDKAMDLPVLTRALSTGEIGLDKMRLAAAVATPETDRELADTAKRCTVHELGQQLRARKRPTAANDQAAYEARSLRFNDPCRTMSVQLPPEDYAATKACIQAQAKAIPSDGETAWDQRCCDALLGILRSAGRSTGTRGGARAPDDVLGRKDDGREKSDQPGHGVPSARSPFFAVLHAPLQALIDPEGTPTGLAGDLEQGGLISLETVRRLLCDSTFVIAVDDDSGHTLYEGRQRRDATATQRREILRRDRCCRFPGCRNTIFTEPHHLDWWIKGGKTDLPNLALLCSYHHHLVHSNGWSVRGNANAELTFVGPNGRATISGPSPMWTTMTSPAANPLAGRPAGGVGRRRGGRSPTS